MPGDIAKEIDALQQMTTSALADRYEELYGQPVRTRHRAYLIRKVAWRIQANAEGIAVSVAAAARSDTPAHVFHPLMTPPAARCDQTRAYRSPGVVPSEKSPRLCRCADPCFTDVGAWPS